mmetsp:Transcript_53234/g.126993  ORF Transcript_53234/g.126993 Transcript_53234/m.126993 type:complete len:496 (+) Transcript_53234:123-1610(+)
MEVTKHPLVPVWDDCEDVALLSSLQFKALRKRFHLHKQRLDKVQSTLHVQRMVQEVDELHAKAQNFRLTRLRRSEEAADKLKRENMRMVGKLHTVIRDAEVRHKQLSTLSRPSTPSQGSLNISVRKQRYDQIKRENAEMVDRLRTAGPAIATAHELADRYHAHRALLSRRKRFRRQNVVRLGLPPPELQQEQVPRPPGETPSYMRPRLPPVKVEEEPPPTKPKPKPKPLAKPFRKMYLLFGPEDSGTNLLQALVEKNWPGKYITQDTRRVLWKHSLSGVEDMYSLLKIPYPRLEQLPAMIVLRSPISQVASWMSAPYELKRCLNRPVANYSQPCRADLRARSSRMEQQRLDLLHFSSSVEVYNSYLRQYRQLMNESRFKSVTVIHYEDMLLTPSKVVKQVADILGEKPLAEFAYLGEETAKPQGPKPHGRDAAIDKLKTRSYLQKVGREGLEVLCPLLDQSLLQDMTEGSFLPPEQQVSYLHDCAGYLGTRQTMK